jgi:hypothetical protein
MLDQATADNNDENIKELVTTYLWLLQFIPTMLKGNRD